MLSRFERRLRSIIYQLLKDYPAIANFTPRYRVWLAQQLLAANLPENITFEDISAIVDRIFDVVITWQSSSQVVLRYQHIEVSQDFADKIINKIVERMSLAYLNNEPWMVIGYTDGQGVDPYLEFSIANPIGIADTNAFVSTWKTDVMGTVATLSNQVQLPLHPSGRYDFVVEWGDGLSDTILTHDQHQVTHTYASPGTYDIMIIGICEGFGFSTAVDDAKKLLDVIQWGTVKLHNYGNQFRGCSNLVRFSAVDSPELQGLTNVRGMFTGATLFNDPNITRWNFSYAVTMNGMFYGASSFNQPLQWSLPALRDARQMFYNATSFNQNLTSWCIPQITSEPIGFATGAPLTSNNKPLWGTCN
jgi:hypothetical protein